MFILGIYFITSSFCGVFKHQKIKAEVPECYQRSRLYRKVQLGGVDHLSIANLRFKMKLF
ncbi:hypothetical protein CDG62_15255 [Acinetobacter sp. WCHA55]|nr:hypothetical protein CDG62_15255 [Acinetobacter sp. WCHA55]